MKRTAVLAALAAGVLALSACSGGGAADMTSGATAAGAGVDSGELAPAATDSEGADSDGTGGGVAGVALLQAAPGASLIRTAELEVVVDDVRAAADDAARVVAAAGGLLEAEERTDDGSYAVATLRLRVPPGAFDVTVGRLAGLGEERSRRLGSEDVTEQVVDLESRLATQQASVARVRALLAEAVDLGEVVLVEAELTARTADLESLEARLAALTARVDLSTISLRLAAEDAPPAAAGAPGFRDGLQGGWEALLAVVRVTGAAVGALLPFSPLLLGLGFLAWRARRTPAVSLQRAGSAG